MAAPHGCIDLDIFVTDMQLTWKMRLCAAGLAAGCITAGGAMPVPQQNALVQKYCAVCHTDAHRNGGLSLEHFDAAHADPGVAAMMLGKLKTGAIGAAGVKLPDDATVEAWISATSAEAAGANRWNVNRSEETLSASIVREVPSTASADVPDSYRLTVSCRADTHEAGMELAWSPGVPKTGQVLSTLTDGKALSTYKVEGTEKMGNGSDLSSGPGSIVLNPTLPVQTLTIRDAFPDETVVFPFGELPQAARQGLSKCFMLEPEADGGVGRGPGGPPHLR